MKPIAVLQKIYLSDLNPVQRPSILIESTFQILIQPHWNWLPLIFLTIEYISTKGMKGKDKSTFSMKKINLK